MSKWLKTVDMVLVFWSATIRDRPSTQLELKLLGSEIERRRKVGETELIVDLIINDQSEATVPRWLRESVRAWKRWETFEAYHRTYKSEKDFLKAFRSVER